jgi:hypothetical protein
MGTISDKLMRIINTKEDIRQALISKGYDVPTSIPFKEYAKMILDLPCNADSFPDIEGIVARYSASGLTNEQMAANPVWVDKTGNGHDLQLKNFSWKGMSGVGGYGDENHQTFYKFTLDDYVFIATPLGVKHMNFTFRVTGLQPGNKLTLAFFGTTNTVYGTWNKDGIYTVDADIVEAGKPTYFYNGYGATRGEFTIEILPLYPGALVFDGVDDYGVCDNFPILTKEKGYTVVALRQWLSFQDIGYPTLVVNSTDRLAAFSFEDFRNKTKSTWNWGKSVGLSDYKIPLLYTYQTSTSYNSKTISAGATEEGSNILQVCCSGFYCANAAIWEIVILDHDATEEELTKIKDYFVKTYPWLFPDQAWTVTGKTNEDEDRATIANITGNGNDLVLSNFAFSGNSGYGEYAYNFSDTSWISISDYGVISDKTSKSFNIKSFVLADYPVLYTAVNKDSSIKKVKIKVTNSIPGFYFGNKPANQIIDLSTDGIYEIPSYNSPNDVTQYGFRCSNVNDSCNITIEQIPEYEGYLVTDGVDDMASSNIVVYEADFTFIGEWKFIQKDDTVAGINSVSHLYIQNRYNRGATVMINSTFENKKNITDYMTFKAITSKGKGYDENWNEVDLLYGDGNKGPSQVSIGGQGGSDFCHMIFKNMALYMNKVFSKDECIKAYNYLQTIKAK